MRTSKNSAKSSHFPSDETAIFGTNFIEGENPAETPARASRVVYEKKRDAF